MPIDSAYRCNFCHSTQGTTFLATERMLGLGGTFSYIACASCGSLQLIDVPKDLSAYYPNTYYSFSSLQYSTFFRRAFKKLRMNAFLNSGWPFFSPPFGDWLLKLNPSFHQRIADVGCGSGQLLYEMSISGFTDLHGFDPFLPETKKISSGLTLWKSDIASSGLCFDLIMMHHSFEHMDNPRRVLQDAFGALAPGGILLVRCPVTDALLWREKGPLWVQLDAPRHLHIPSTNGFQVAAKEIGFSIREIIFDSTGFQFWGTGLYERGEILDRSKIKIHFTAQELAAWEEKAKRYNQSGEGDQACFYCQKPKI